MHIYITAANSFIGRHLALYFLSKGIRLSASYRIDDQRIENLKAHPLCSLIRMDIADREAFGALPPRIDAVVHVAGVSPTSLVTVDDMLACNVIGTQNVLHYALQARAAKLIYTSSLSVHGHVLVPVIDETTATNAPHVYGASKLLGERLVAQVAERLPAVALRLPGILGTGAHRAWVPRIMQQLRAGKEILVYNPNNLFNNAVHVDDLSAFCHVLLENEWRDFHAMPLGGKNEITIRDVVDLLADGAGTDTKIKIIPSLQSGFIISSKYATDVLGYEPADTRNILQRYAESPGRPLDGPHEL